MSASKQKLPEELKKLYLPRFSEAILSGRQAIKPEISFEFFPPKTDEAEAKLWQSIKTLEKLGPRFVSVTYGAGGTTRERTHKTVVRIAKETSLKPAAHLTCVGATRAEIDEIAKGYWASGIKHIVALRGDAPAGSGKYIPHENGYDYAVDLVTGLKKIADFEISVAAYPETHPEAASAAADIDNLKRKLDAGATRAITQFFFDADVFFDFQERAAKAGISAEIVPGIVPISNFTQITKFAAACGANIPDWLKKLFENLENDAQSHSIIATIVALEQARILLQNGAKQLHFYTLNRADLTYAICHALGI